MSKEKMEQTIMKLLEDVSKLKLENADLTKRIKELEEGSIGTGVYLDGCPDYAKDFISNKDKKVGE